MSKKKPTGEIILFQSADGQAKIQVRFEEKTVWLSQKSMADLYHISVKTINEHVVNIYDEAELSPEATIRKFRIVQIKGKREVKRIVDHYNLEAILAVGYRVRSQRGTQFRQWATVQNKLHWAIHGKTAAEVIKSRANTFKKNMGLTNWKNSPTGPIRKQDVSIAKNYLSDQELTALNRIVTMYLDYAEEQAESRKPMHMADWVKKLDGFLQFNEKNILTHAGKISHQIALEHAESEFEKYEEERRRLEVSRPVSDFDKVVAKLTSKSDRKKKK